VGLEKGKNNELKIFSKKSKNTIVFYIWQSWLQIEGVTVLLLLNPVY